MPTLLEHIYSYSSPLVLCCYSYIQLFLYPTLFPLSMVIAYPHCGHLNWPIASTTMLYSLISYYTTISSQPLCCPQHQMCALVPLYYLLIFYLIQALRFEHVNPTFCCFIIPSLPFQDDVLIIFTSLDLLSSNTSRIPCLSNSTLRTQLLLWQALSLSFYSLILNFVFLISYILCLLGHSWSQFCFQLGLHSSSNPLLSHLSHLSPRIKTSLMSSHICLVDLGVSTFQVCLLLFYCIFLQTYIHLELFPCLWFLLDLSRTFVPLGYLSFFHYFISIYILKSSIDRFSSFTKLAICVLQFSIEFFIINGDFNFVMCDHKYFGHLQECSSSPKIVHLIDNLHLINPSLSSSPLSRLDSSLALGGHLDHSLIIDPLTCLFP